MSVKTFLRKSIKNSNTSYIHPNQIIKLRMEQEGKFIKAVSEMIQNPRHLFLEYITKNKPKLNITRGIREKSKLLLSHELDSFRQTVYDINQKHLNIKKEKYKPFKENEKSFIEKYQLFKKHADKKILNDKKLLKDLRNNLLQKDIKAPLLNPKKNLFDKNLLLQRKENIEDFLSYKAGTIKGNCKAFKYLDKLNETVSEKVKNNINITKFYQNEGIDISTKNKKKKNDKYFFLNEQLLKDNNSKLDLTDTKDEIINVEETLDGLKNFDEFLNMNNQDYMDLLNQKKKVNVQNSKKNTVLSIPDFNKSISEFHKSSLDGISQSLVEDNKIKKIPVTHLNKSFYKINKRNDIFKKINLKRTLFKTNNIKKFPKYLISPNNSIEGSMNISDKSFSKKKIKIKKFNLNRNHRKKSINSIDSRMSTIYPSTTYDKFLIKSNKNINKKKIPILSKSKSTFDFNKINPDKEGTQIVYDMIKQTDNSLIYDDLIKNYFRKKIGNEKIFELTKFDLFHEYKLMSKKFYWKDFIGKNIKMKKDIDFELNTIDKFNKFSTTTNFQVKKIKEKIEKIMDSLSEPVKEGDIV